MSSKVILSIGCNAQHAVQIQHARERLKEIFPDARFTDPIDSPDYENLEKAHYSNMLAEFSTSLSEDELLSYLKELEVSLGNTTQLRSKGVVLMDLDLLSYNASKHHLSDWTRPYIKTLLKRLKNSSLLLVVLFYSSFTPLLLLFYFSFTPSAFAQSGSAPKALLGKAIEYYTSQKYHECIVSFSELQKHYTLNPRYTAYLGYSYYKEAQYADAVHYLEDGIPKLQAYSPFEQATYIYACAESYFSMQDYANAIPWYLKAMPLVNGIDKGDVCYHTGFAHYMLGNNTDAALFLHQADSIYNDSIYSSSLDKQHIARKAQTHTMLRALK